MSLIPVREALHALAGEGLVTYRPRRGYVVTELDLADLEEVYRLRRLLETDALRRGVPRATTPTTSPRSSEMPTRASRRPAPRDIAGQLAANRRFHDRLHGLAGERAAHPAASASSGTRPRPTGRSTTCSPARRRRPTPSTAS